MKNLVLSILFLLPITISANTIQLITATVPVEFTCVIPGHGGGCGVESYILNAPDEAEYVKVFTTFKEEGVIQSFDLDSDNTESLKLITSLHINQSGSDLLLIGTDETLGNILFFNADKQLIETRKVIFKANFVEEY